MKMSFEKKYKSVWHCIVGRNFGAYVTHEVGRYIYFYIGQKGFLIWSTPSWAAIINRSAYSVRVINNLWTQYNNSGGWEILQS